MKKNGQGEEDGGEEKTENRMSKRNKQTFSKFYYLKFLIFLLIIDIFSCWQRCNYVQMVHLVV